MSKTHNAPILSFVAAYWKQHQRAPSYREIGAAVGISSSDHVARDLRHLARDGYISLASRRTRSLVVLKGYVPTTETPCPVTPASPPRSRRRHAPHTLEQRSGHCRGCGILVMNTSRRTLYCADCKTGAPFIQCHTLMGQDRFFMQSGAQLFAGFESIAERAHRKYHQRRGARRVKA